MSFQKAKIIGCDPIRAPHGARFQPTLAIEISNIGCGAGLDSPRGLALDSARKLYVTSIGDRGDQISIYPADANGEGRPIAVIAGRHTRLSSPQSITISSDGRIYVANSGGGYHDHGSITVYRAGSHGDVRPAAVISGSRTNLDAPFGIALDSRGDIYETNCDGPVTWEAGSINVYRAGSSGNVAPLTTIVGGNTALACPRAITLGHLAK